MRPDPRVPAPLIAYVSRIVCDNVEDDDKGLARLRADALERAADLEDAIFEELHCGKCGAGIEDKVEDPYLAHLRAEKSAWLYQASVFDKEIRVRTRLIDIELMKEAFQLLLNEFDNDYSWPVFADAAIRARMNFKEYRRLERKAKQLGKRISKSAAALAKLVRELQETGVGLPAELMPVIKEGALVAVSGPSEEARHLQLRRLVLANQRVKSQTVKSETDVANPDITSHLWRISKVANEFQPDLMSPAIRSATSTRQNSNKAFYIRAFATLLREGMIDITPLVKRAMAITGNVIFDDPNMNITEDDVRKALAFSERARDPQARVASRGKVRRS